MEAGGGVRRGEREEVEEVEVMYHHMTPVTLLSQMEMITSLGYSFTDRSILVLRKDFSDRPAQGAF